MYHSRKSFTLKTGIFFVFTMTVYLITVLNQNQTRSNINSCFQRSLMHLIQTNIFKENANLIGRLSQNLGSIVHEYQVFQPLRGVLLPLQISLKFSGLQDCGMERYARPELVVEIYFYDLKNSVQFLTFFSILSKTNNHALQNTYMSRLELKF